MYKRPKESALFNVVGGYWTQEGEVKYVAHAITDRGRAILLRDPQPPAKGNTKIAEHHPDRLYWEKGITRPADLRLQRDEHLARLEIDCTLLPCDGKNDGCTFTVPPLIRKWGFDSKLELRVFSYHDEGEGKRRHFRCSLGDSKEKLLERRGDTDEWNWKAWLEDEDPANPYP